jgi:oligoendopeptidase F
MKIESYETSPWSLEDLYTSSESPDMRQALADLESRVEAFEQIRPALKDEIGKDDFIGIIQQLEGITSLAYRIHGFASLQFSADTQDEAALAFMAKIDQLMAEMQNRALFFSLWWKDLDDEIAERLMADTGDYQYWLEEMRHFKPHTLSEPEEKIINIKDVTGSRALNKLYDSITNRYVYKVSVEGEEKELTRGQLMVHVRSSDPDLRAAAYRELYRVFGEDGPILGQVYQTLVRDWHNEQVQLRKYKTPISARNLANDVPDAVVDTLLEVCQQNAAVFQRFFQLKAKILGMEVLRRCDIYAPLAEAEKNYPFDSGMEMVLDSFQGFDARVADLARRVFEEDHLDSQVRKGKRDGAFCATVTPDLTPWVLLNYQGRAEDVATMAHELGHAVHALLADHHSVFTQHSSLPLAETASTFAEMLLVDSMLDQERDQKVRRDILFKQVDDSYATIMRQAYFAVFEKQAHEVIKADATVEDLSTAYMRNLEDQFGDAVALSEEFRWEWVSIPHIYQVPFYVYAYAFGQLLVLSLYQQFKTEGEAFKPRYIEILSAGGSKAPVEILTGAGIDVSTPVFWQGGFDVISAMVDELERLSE